ncbi:MAG: choice-of-anchor J domain-containing protein, partial [Muribaculaceae bacterium]|nr:choice-of-anchor J domain-containing protein [Muribaculaceae bacterium]
LVGSDYVEIAEYITTSKTGVYYIGFHGISDPDTYQLHLDEISVEAGISAMVPGVPNNLKAVPDAHGEYKAAISVKAPTVTFSGAELDGTMTMEIKRDNTVIYRASNVAPGETVSCNDNLTKGGRVTYSAYAMNGEGSGNPASVNVHIGYSFPAAVEEVKLSENPQTPGVITLSWPEVTLDDNGLVYPQGAVSYLIYVPGDYGWNLTYRDIMEPEYTFRAVAEGEQTFVSYAVCGLSEGGQGDFAFTGLQAVGTPFKGFSESFPDGALSYPMIMETLAQKGMEWSIYSDASGVESQDKDNGFLGAQASGIGDISSITSPKISLSGIDSPILSFYTYNIKGTKGEKDINTVAVEVREPGGAYARVKEATVDALCNGEEGWGRVNVDLSDYAGKTVQFRIVAECNIFDLTLFDNIRLGQSYAKDLSVVASAPSKVASGEEYKVSGYVRNEGYLDVAGFKVRLITEGAEPAESLLDCPQLKAGEKYEFEYDCILHPLQESEVVHRVEVIMDGDANEENNHSEALSIHPVLSTLPAATNLKGEVNADGIALTWDEPDLTGKRSVEKEDDFEIAKSWSRELEGWTFIDRDGSPVGGFQGMTLPGIDQQSLQSFFVFDSTLGNSSFEAHSGIKYLASLFRSDQGTVDDWAISPELTGEAQTISFFAKSYSGTFAEKIEIYYSKGSLNPDDFVSLLVVEKVPSDWTRYEAALPEGAKHFAIRSCGTDTFMLMLDDFKYEVAEETAGLTVEGYNLYRNSLLVNETPLKDREYLDSKPAEGN